MGKFIVSLATILALGILGGCATNRHALVNGISSETKQGRMVVTNIARSGPGRGFRNREAPASILLATSDSDDLRVNLHTADPDFSPDPSLMDLALEQVQRDWKRFKGSYVGNRLVVDFWLLPEGMRFQHRDRVVLERGARLHLTFVVDIRGDQPAIDAIASAVETLSHELYHVSRFDPPSDDVLAEEANAHARGFCSKFAFALAAQRPVAFRFHLQPSWRDRVFEEGDNLFVRVPREVRDSTQRSQFGLAIFIGYLAGRTGSERIDTSDPEHAAVVAALCERLEHADLPVVKVRASR